MVFFGFVGFLGLHGQSLGKVERVLDVGLIYLQLPSFDRTEVESTPLPNRTISCANGPAQGALT